MKGSRFSFLMVLIPLLMLCFISVPVLSDSGDEDPWDADDSGNSDGTYHDTLPSEDLGFDVAPNDPDAPLDWLTSLVFSISLEVTDFFFGGTNQPLVVTPDVQQEQGTDDVSMSGSNRN